MNDQKPLTAAQVKEAEFKLSKVLVKTIAHEPFYATLLLQNKPQLSEMLPTAWVSRRGMYFNPRFVLEHSVEELLGVAIHETLHKVFGHVFRLGGRDPRRWNVVCDAIINDIITRQQGYKLPAMAIDWPAEEVRGFTAEELYAKHDDPDNGGGWDGSPDMVDEGEPTEKELLDNKRLVAGAVANAKQQGKMPAGLDRLIGELLEPKKNWKELLECTLISLLVGNDLFSYTRPSIVGRQLGCVMPTLSRASGMRRLVCGIDTSGSISADELKMFVSELRGITDAVGIQEVHVVYCDADIHDVHIVEQGMQYEPSSVGGGGGTSFQPVFDYAEENDAEALVYMTDMYCWFPERPEFPVVWGATTDTVGPYGTTINIRE